MRADRLLSIIWLLRAHEKLSTGELADLLEVSRRTIMRDIDALSAAGVPVYSERGPHGGIRLLPGYRTDVTALSSEESRALFAGVTAWGAESLGLGDALASGLRKLLAAVPDGNRQSTADVSSRIVVDPQGWMPQTAAEQTGTIFRTVQNAVFAQQLLHIKFRHKTKDPTRQTTAQPHGLVSAGRSWYLCCSIDDEVHFVKLSRIDEAKTLPQPCDPRNQVNVAKAWKAHRSRFLDTFTPVVATAWVKHTRWSDVHEWVIKATQTEPTSTSPGAGWSYFELEFVDQLHAMTIMLRLGPDARVETPAELKRDFTNLLLETLTLYESSEP